MKTGIRFTVKHEIRGRIRIHLTRGRLSIRQADLFSFYLASLPQVTAAKVYERIGDAAISYTGTKEDLIAEILKFSFDDEKLNELVPTTGTRALNQEFQEKLVTKCLTRCCDPRGMDCDPVCSVYHQRSQKACRRNTGSRGPRCDRDHGFHVEKRFQHGRIRHVSSRDR